MALIALALLLPLIGGLALPLFKFENAKRRSWYVEGITLATSV